MGIKQLKFGPCDGNTSLLFGRSPGRQLVVGLRHLQRSLSLIQLRLQQGIVETNQRLPGLDEVALPDQHL